jgi:hypothetical protein
MIIPDTSRHKSRLPVLQIGCSQFIVLLLLERGSVLLINATVYYFEVVVLAQAMSGRSVNAA